jgi:hypothetical protein
MSTVTYVLGSWMLANLLVILLGSKRRAGSPTRSDLPRRGRSRTPERLVRLSIPRVPSLLGSPCKPPRARRLRQAEAEAPPRACDVVRR